MRLKVVSIRSTLEERRSGLICLPNEMLEHLLTFCDRDSLFKTRQTSSRLCMFSSKGLAERLQLDWRGCLSNKMTPVELLRHHPLKYFANLSVHVSKSEFALSWLKRHHLNTSIIPSLLRLYPDGNMSLPTNMLLVSSSVFGILDTSQVIAWHRNGACYTPVVFPCVEKVTHVYDNGSDHVYAIRCRGRLILVSTGNPVDKFFLSELAGREIQSLYNRPDEIFVKLNDNKLLLMTSSNPHEKVPERLLERKIQTVCILSDNLYLKILENGELVGWGKGVNKWDFLIPKHNMIPEKVLSITPNSVHKAVSLVLEDGCTILQSGFLFPRDASPSKLLLQLRDRVKRIYSTRYTHVALLYDGTIAVWGELYGGEAPIVPKDTTVRSIHQTLDAFAVLLENGRLLVLGNPNWGGRLPVQIQNRTVIEMFSTLGHFLALLDDHTIFSWGSERNATPMPSRLIGARVKTIFSNQCYFVALLESGALYCWGIFSHPEGKKVMIPEDRRVKNVIPIDETFVIQLDNDALFLLKVSRENNYRRWMVMQYRLPLPEGMHLAVMDREM